MQEHFSITLPSDSLYLCDRQERHCAWLNSDPQNQGWGEYPPGAGGMRVLLSSGPLEMEGAVAEGQDARGLLSPAGLASGSPGEMVMLMLHLLCIRDDEIIKQQEGEAQKWKEHDGKEMPACQEEEPPGGAGGEKGNPCLWATWLSSLAWKTSADKRSLLFCSGSNKHFSIFFLLGKREVYVCGCERCLGHCNCLGEAHLHPCVVPRYWLRALAMWLCLLCQFKKYFTFLNIKFFYRDWSIFREARRGSQFPGTLLKNSTPRLF